MPEKLLSVGLDVGTTSTQLVVSELTVENTAGSFCIPELEIADRQIVYKSPVHFTPLLDESHVDGAQLRTLVAAEYKRAGIGRQDVDTGAVIITGETSRKENAQTVLQSLSDFAGDFVVATAGPDLESVLAAKGAGAVAFSQDTGANVLHMDIGGGTANLAWISAGRIRATGCLNVGGRLIKIREDGQLSYVSEVLRGLWSPKVGDVVTQADVQALATSLAQVLEMAAGLRQPTPWLERLITVGSTPICPDCGQDWVLSFSGGVADCIDTPKHWLAFGDMGPELGQAIRQSRLCAGTYRLGQETIRATVIGAGCHSAQLSGSTVFHQNMVFPLKNLPVITLEEENCRPEYICRLPAFQEGNAVLALTQIQRPGYEKLSSLAEALAAIPAGRQIIVALEQDMAKALGQLLALRLGSEAQILCLDRVRLSDSSYLDVGAPVGPALPVVVKTLVLSR